MIPKGWKLKNLEEIGEFKNGINKSKEDFGFGVPFVNLMDVFGTSAIGKKNYALVNATHKETQDFNLVKGDVLFIRSSVKPQGVGLTSVVIEDIENTVYSGFIIRFRPKIAIDHNFMRYCFYERGFRLRLLSNSTISANTNINQQALNKLTVLIPPLLEQCKIAEILGVWDESIDLLEKLIGRVRSRKQGLMQQLLTGKKRFKEFEGSEWGKYKLGRLVKKIGSGITPKGGREVYLDRGIPLIRSQNVLWGKLSLKDVAYISLEQHSKMRNTQLKYNDVLLNITGASIGRSCVFAEIESMANVNQHVCIIRTAENLDPLFLSGYLNSQFGQAQILSFQAGGNREGLNFEQIRNFNIILPPLPEQEKIAAVLSAADEEISTLEKQLAAYKQQKLGLMQQLLTGKIRVGMIQGTVGAGLC
jgi:type I restriction enzyme, S subunit